jgi:rare lipoprotein A (peptidoglycan hydrolase)
MRMRRTIGLSLALLAVSATAIARQAQTGHDHSVPSSEAKPAKVDAIAANHQIKQRRAHGRLAARSEPRQASHARRHAARLPPPDRYIGPLQVIGQREIGSAAWYGGHHIGRRTASGDRLDAVHLTAAHRSLPLHSLVRVTNLSNGRSVVARITDRGPVSQSLLIDVSPSVADELDMKRAGIVKVTVEPVAPASNPPR